MGDAVSVNGTGSAPRGGHGGGYTVARAAALVGVSVRTLHHWDEIGLLVPGERSSAGYRLYSAADLARAQQVLVYRELDFPLADIARLLDDPEVDELGHLERQEALLEGRISRLAGTVSAVRRLKEAKAMGGDVSPQQRAEIFGVEWNPEYDAEARRRWGDTPEWEESQRRTTAMDADGWRAVKAETDALEADLGAAVRDGVDPASERAADLVERHRLSVDRFYPCSTGKQMCLVNSYLADPRFTGHYESVQPGLTRWLREAVALVAAREGVDPENPRWE